MEKDFLTKEKSITKNDRSLIRNGVHEIMIIYIPRSKWATEEEETKHEEDEDMKKEIKVES